MECHRVWSGFTLLRGSGAVQERRSRGRRPSPARRAPTPVPSQTPGRVWRGAGLGRGPRGGGCGAQTKAQLAERPARASGARGPEAGPGAPGGAVRGRGLAPGGRGGGRGGGAGDRSGGGGGSGPCRPEDSAGWRSGWLRAGGKRASGAGRAMGQRAADALLLALLLLLHGWLLAVSVRGGGTGAALITARRARQLGGGAEAARLGLWFGTAAPARDPGPAQTGTTLPRGAVGRRAQGTLRGIMGGTSPRGSPWVSRPRCRVSKSR